MSQLARAFAGEVVTLLRDTYLPRLASALQALPAADLWWRPHDGTTSAGNLLLHLEGNVRQWILSGLGGVSDQRQRSQEFAAQEGAGAAQLLAALQATVGRACTVIEGLDEAALLARRDIQGFAVTGLGAVLHVAEHFSWHTGQVTWIAKQRAGADHGVGYYDVQQLDRARNPGPA